MPVSCAKLQRMHLEMFASQFLQRVNKKWNSDEVPSCVVFAYLRSGRGSVCDLGPRN
jgi:hypothetical protein